MTNFTREREAVEAGHAKIEDDGLERCRGESVLHASQCGQPVADAREGRAAFFQMLLQDQCIDVIVFGEQIREPDKSAGVGLSTGGVLCGASAPIRARSERRRNGLTSQPSNARIVCVSNSRRWRP